MMLMRGLAFLFFAISLILFTVHNNINYGIWAIIFLMFVRGGK